VRALEETYEHRFPVDYARLELDFVAPLLPRPDWLKELGVDEEAHWRLVGTLGNITWVLKQKPPALRVVERRADLARLTRSNLELVRDYTHIEHWTATEIEQRSARLAVKAIAIWPGPTR
jgi:hypothetical protein